MAVNYSETQGALVSALLKAQAEFPPILKTKRGQSGNRTFNYAPLDEVLDAVRPVLLKHQLLLTQGTDGHELLTRLDHVSGEWREHRMPINSEHANMQSYGIELTYRRRYAIQPMLGIITEEDTDGRGDKTKRKGIDHTEPRNENGTKQGIGIHNAARMAFDALQPEVQDILRKTASEVVMAVQAGSPARAIQFMELACYNWPEDDMVKPALWSLLDSQTRSAIKKYQSEKE